MIRYLFVVLFLSITAGLLWWQQQRLAVVTTPTAAPIQVVVATAAEREFLASIEALATVSANEAVTLSATVTEQVRATHFSDGQQVKAGQLLVELVDDEERAALQLAQVTLREQQREHRRIEDLVKRKIIASSELDRIQSLIEAAEAQADSARARLAERQIRAPFSGQLGLRQISVGTLVTPGTVLATLDDLASVNLDFNVPERYLADLKIGAEITARADAWPEQPISATVSTIAARIDPISRSVTVRAKAANPDRLLRPGMLLKLALISQRHQSVAVAEEALLQVADEQFLFVVNADDKVERRVVRSGLRASGWVEIIDGLAVGEQVIVRGTQKVRPGSSIQRSHEPWMTAAEAR